jgi:acetylornithine deacetylase/succinyl-diaminopimelate desuccinylase-like protein
MRVRSTLCLVVLVTSTILSETGSGRQPVTGVPASGETIPSSPHDRLARELLAELININTTDSSGDNTRAAEAMAARLRHAGFPAEDVRVLAPAPRKGNLVARLRGSGEGRPLLLLAHLDVVEARREDWTLDPFSFVEKDGYFYGRGTSDDKYMAAIFVANLIRLKQEGVTPDRDIIVALTADEEGGPHNGVSWLLREHRALIEAEFCINEGGDGVSKNGRPLINEVQAAEKVYLTFRLEAKNPGGHSSLPVGDNAIYHIAGALTRIAAHAFPIRLNEVTRGYFQRTERVETGEEAAAMRALLSATPDSLQHAGERLARMSAFYNAQLRTTCVATGIEGGHAENALPQVARATVNCRLLPGEDPKQVERTLAKVIADAKVTIRPLAQVRPSPASPLRPAVMAAVETITKEMFPGAIVVPTMATGATDGLYLRNADIPTYGLSGVFFEAGDVRAHGQDERVGVREYYEGREFLYRLTRALSQLPGSR